MGQEKTVTRDETHPRKTLQYSVGVVFVLVAIVCVILAQFYPRVYAAVQLQVPVYARYSAEDQLVMHSAAIRSPAILRPVIARIPEAKRLARGDTFAWLSSEIDARPLDPDRLEIRLVGYPKDRRLITKMVDAIADEYVEFLGKEVQQEIDELTAARTHEQRKARPDNAMIRKIDERLAEVDSRLAKLPIPTSKVIDRRLGWGR